MKMFNKVAQTLVVVALVVASHSTFAQQRQGVKINGVVNQTTVANRTTAVALGQGAHAANSIGAIHDGTVINGVVNQTTIANRTTAVALGRNSKACNNIGQIGSNPNC